MALDDRAELELEGHRAEAGGDRRAAAASTAAVLSPSAVAQGHGGDRYGRIGVGGGHRPGARAQELGARGAVASHWASSALATARCGCRRR